MDGQLKTLVILGASGDLAGRLLLPAVGQLLSTGHPLTLVGAGAEQWDDDEWRAHLRAAFSLASGPDVDRVLSESRYLAADVTSTKDLQRLVDAGTGAPAIYFALPPAVTAQACAALAEVTLPAGTALVLEKPFGVDRAGASALNTLVRRLVPEDRVHRIDSFLASAIVSNVLGLRFADPQFEPIWNADHIERVDVVFDETLGLEHRARYYDRAGALVDMLQSHLLQVVALVATDVPVNGDDLWDNKAAVIRACRVWGDDPATASRRARYTAGTVEGRELPSYVDEDGVDPALHTETLAEITLQINTPRWSGVPFRIRSGKAIAHPRKEVVVTFRPVAGSLFRRLRLPLGPVLDGIELTTEGPDAAVQTSGIELPAEFRARTPVYREVLESVFAGDPALSVRGDTAEECWRIVDPVIVAWRTGQVPLDEYPAGSWGPAGWASSTDGDRVSIG